MDTFYRRRLPHWHPENRDIFLTWRLHGSLPRHLLKAGHGPALQGGRQFVAFDRELDRDAAGPTWLAKPEIAAAVSKALLAGEAEWHLYKLHAWVIMPNHVHLLIAPKMPLATITRHIKSASARAANKLLGRQGRPFWAVESYDHWVRTEDEFQKIAHYIEDNPARAGLLLPQ